MMSSPQRKWTVGFVNYKTSIYMKWQLQSFYAFNDPNNFKIVVLDNSRDEAEKAALEKLAAPYIEKYNNIELVFHNPVDQTASGQHGEGLTLILQKCADTEYILFQDPDFFWVKQNILNWFESFFDQGKVAIGAPYSGKMGVGHPNFPAVYGCAHRVSDIKHLDLHADASDEAREKSFRLYPLSDGFHFSYDVAWKLRDALSLPDTDKNFISFEDYVALEIYDIFGRHSFETITRKYIYHGKLIAYHLFRGSFTGAVTEGHEDPRALTPSEWLVAREKFGSFFFQVLKRDGKPPFRIQQIRLAKVKLKKFIRYILFKSLFSFIFRFFARSLKNSKIGLRIVNSLKRRLGVV